MQLCSSLNTFWQFLTLGLDWKLAFSSPIATAEFSKFSGILSAALESWRSFLYSSSVYSCHLFLISSAFVRSILFLSFIEPIFAWNVPLISLIFFKRSLVFSILLFSCISLHWLLGRLSYFSLILWNSAFRWVYLFFSPLPFTFLSQLFVRPPQVTIFLFAFLFIEDDFDHCLLSMSWTSIHNSSVTLSDLIPWVYLSLPLYNKEFDLGHTWMV